MRDLENLIAQWRKQMQASLGASATEEMEDHLREEIAQLVTDGAPQMEAFQQAVKRLGSEAAISAEFGKVDRVWRPMKGAFAVVAIVALAATFFGGRVTAKPLGWILGPHVFAATLGYVCGFVLGATGICFLAQRCFKPFAPSYLGVIGRQAGGLAGVAAGMTALAIGLGMIWKHLAWGRAWSSDAKELGGAAIFIWFTGIFIAQRRGWLSTRGIMMAAVLGNVVVALGWFGANLIYTAATGWMGQGMLIAFALSQFAVLLLGFVPEGFFSEGDRNPR